MCRQCFAAGIACGFAVAAVSYAYGQPNYNYPAVAMRAATGIVEEPTYIPFKREPHPIDDVPYPWERTDAN